MPRKGPAPRRPLVIGLLGAIPGLLSRATTPSYVAFVICFLIFAFTGLSPR